MNFTEVYERNNCPKRSPQSVSKGIDLVTVPDVNTESHRFSGFDGSSSWLTFEKGFRRFMDENQDLSQAELLSVFGELLKGDAANYFRQQCHRYGSIWLDGNMEMVFLIMGKRFGAGTVQVPWPQFHRMSQADKEEVEDWAARILIVTYRAFPFLSQAEVMKRALAKFWDGLADSRMANFVGQCQPRNLEGAVQCCRRFITYSSKNKESTSMCSNPELEEDPKGNGSMWPARH